MSSSTSFAQSQIFKLHTGIGVSYLAPLWPFEFTVNVALDGGAPITVTLTDPANATPGSSTDGAATVKSAPLWTMTGLEDIEHSLVVSKSDTGPFVIVDAFQ